jgi:conjugative relaxase-like TrwC/TraI family protein
MLTIGRLGQGAEAASYYLNRQAGCDLDYYTGEGEPRGVWCGSASRDLGVSRVLDADGEALLRRMLAGQDRAGSAVVPPVLRGDPRGRVLAAVLVRAVDARAVELGIDAAGLVGDQGLARALDIARVSVATDSRLPRRPRASVAVDVAGRVARAAGLDPAEVFRGPAGEDVFGVALEFVDARVDVRRAGLDLTFSAPKSASVLFGLGDERVSEQVAEAHRVAVRQTLGYLEQSCARAARGHHEAGQICRRIETGGWSAVAFEHRSSRCGDPQLHTHVVVPNMVEGVDGRWSAWDTSEAYRQATTGGYLYQAVLRAELTRRLGVSWGPVRRGVAEIQGIDVGLRRVFSKRRREIEEHLDAHGFNGPKAAQISLFATRRPKTAEGILDLRVRWSEQARAAGFSPPKVIRQTVEAAAARPPLLDLQAIRSRVLGARGVTARSSSFDRRALLRAVCEAVPAGADVDVDDLRGIATDLVRDQEVVPLVSAAAPEVRRYSTAELLTTESTALQRAADRAADGLAAVPAEAAAAGLRGSRLSTEQAAAVHRIVTSGAGVDVIIGPAGAGKTAALLTAYGIWQHAGIDVRGTALAAIAARTLEAGTGIRSQSLTRLTAAARRGDRERGLPDRGGVLIVDEAGMVGTRDLASLSAMTQNAGVKLVLVGDPAQLPEIDAGGLFGRLAQQLQASVLAGNLRQREVWERDALQLLRDGDVLAAIDAYEVNGRLHVYDVVRDARTAIITDYLAACDTAPSVVMLTSRRADARAMNTLTRRALLAAGRLGDKALVVDAARGRVEWRVGDEAVVTANHYPLSLINGSRGRVSAIHRDGITVTTDAGNVRVPLEQLQAGVLDYGYALTCHKAQGITVDVALLYASSALTREAGYVGMSRGRIANHVYGTLDALVPEVDPDLDHAGHDPISSTERAELTRSAVVERFETSGRQRLASTQADDRVRQWMFGAGRPSAIGRGR